MKINKGNDERFYTSIYTSVLARLKANESIETIYDDRGINISKNLINLTGYRTFRNALDLGCGLGQVAVSLSVISKSVIAADILQDSLKIVSEVIKKKNINNIYPVLLDAAHLPFREKVMDLIICSGVLEWVATGKDFNMPTEKVQRNMLFETSRLLNQKGVFWLGIENRYAYNYFLGYVDHHSGLRFITVLPRFIANIYSKLVKKRPYRNYLYNYWELKKLLLNSGLAIDSFLTAFPYYSNPKLVASLSNFNEVKKMVILAQDHDTLSAIILKIIINLRLFKLLFPNFIVLCHKSNY
jgi:ubiquinone/menaquinone biosynthesis C-methylase UbiE